MPLKILNWNIESFGATRQIPDRQTQVARVLADEQADIVCVQELLVSKLAAARSIVAEINRLLPHPLQYNYILCPRNGFEMYLYLYRVGAGLQALTLRQDGLVRLNNNQVPAAVWEPHVGNTQAGTGSSGLDHYFPLFSFKETGAARPPGLGLFRYTDAHGATRDICVMNWHNDAGSRDFRRGSITRLAETPIVETRAFHIATTTGASLVDNIIIAGDFNDALQPNPFVGYTVHITENTHLHRFDRENDGRYRTSAALRDACYDNFVTSLNGLAAAGVQVIDLPLRLWNERTGRTRDALVRSDLLAPGAREAADKKRLLARFPPLKKKGGISKTTRARYGAFLSRHSLRGFRPPTLQRRIAESFADLSVAARENLTRRTLDFVERELTGDVRWSVRRDNAHDLLLNDALYLTRAWMSDHLPTVMTLNP